MVTKKDQWPQQEPYRKGVEKLLSPTEIHQNPQSVMNLSQKWRLWG